MEKHVPRYKGVVAVLATCVLCAGVVLFSTGCPTTRPPAPPPPPCTSDADCDEGEVCNTETGACEPEPTGCTSDEGCAEGEFCDTQTGECVPNENLYDTIRFDTELDAVHMTPAGHMNCTVCHHVADTEAGIPDATATGCVPCHSDDPNVDNSFKSVAHDSDGDNNGCRLCHDDEQNADGTWDCSFCHPLVE